MKNTINFSFLNNATQFRLSNPILNAILLLAILVLLPLLIILGFATLVVIAVIARLRAITHFYRSEKATSASGPIHFEPHNATDDGEGFSDYSIIEEKIGK